MTKFDMQKKICETLKSIWEEEIKVDYDDKYLLREDTLKNALYFHLRNRLGRFLEKNNLRIYTEFRLDNNCKADMIIVRVDNEREEYNLDYIEDVLYIIEIKYKSYFNAHKIISKDYEKIKTYIQDLKFDCLYCMATIWEYWDDETSWLENGECDWAKDKLLELNASFDEYNEMRFYIKNH